MNYKNNLLPTAGIFIPTMNRVDFVIRQLRYYAAVQCPHTIYIGDSSPPEESQKIAQEISKLGSTIRAQYFFLPNHDDWQAHYYLITQVKEKYICYSGDDDYQIPNSITRCIEWLENHSEYTSAGGYAVNFRLKQSGPYGQLKELSDYPRQQIEEDTAASRMKRFFDNYYVTHFAVNKTTDLVNYWSNDSQIADRQFKSEILPTTIPLIYGKSKVLDCLSLVRQMHDRRSFLPNTFDWLTSPNWHHSYFLFEKTLSQHLAKKDRLPLDEATKIIKHSFLKYLIKRLQKDNELYDALPPKSFWRLCAYFLTNQIRPILVKIFPFSKHLYRSYFKPALTKKREMHYEVLRARTKYYQDFKPIMDSFTTHD